MTPILARGEKSTMAAFALRQLAAVCAQRRLSSETRADLPPAQRLRPRSRQRAMNGTGRGRICGLSDGLPKSANGEGGVGGLAGVGGSWQRCLRWAGHREVQGLGWKAQRGRGSSRECVDILNVWARKSSRMADK